jgi:hypothetical protein
MPVNLAEIRLRLITDDERIHFHTFIQKYHYLGSRRAAGESLYYVATYHEEWVALLSFSSAALKCAARDQWIGWPYRHQYDRLLLATNNSRFLILPQWHYPNLATRVLSLCQRRIQADWYQHFNHPLLLLETFVDPSRFHGTVYRAANWLCVGQTRGFERVSGGGYAAHGQPKWVFVYPLQRNARKLLSQPILPKPYHCGEPKLMLNTEQMAALPDCFKSIRDPRRAQGRRHRLTTVLSIAAGAILCGRTTYKAMAEWADSLGQKARKRFKCYYHYDLKSFQVPSESVIRDVLVRVDPQQLNAAANQWNQQFAQDDESLAIDGKTMRNAIDDEGRPTHIISAIGHQSLSCHTQKKSALCP